MSQQKENIEPVYFMDLVVENVRCFKDEQVMDLSDGNGKPARWTIILGDNGTGKTSLLKSLVFLKPDDKDGFSGKKRKSAAPFGLYTHYRTEDFTSVNKGGFLLGSKYFFKGKINSTSSNLIKGYSFSTNNQSGVLAYAESPLVNDDNFILIAYGATRQIGVGALVESKNNNSVANLLDPTTSLINAEAWLLETDFAIKSSEGDIKKHLQYHYLKVKETLKKLLPDIQEFRVKAITKTNIQAAIEVKTPYGWVDMKNLSLGYQTFIAWVVDLAARLFNRYPDSDSPLEEPCIVLVDEIDLHLHPKWQRKIIGFLTDIFKNAQFIVTAHSPLIVQAAADANIVLLKREGDSVRIHNNMDEQAIDDWRFDQILTSELFGLDSARSPKYDAYIERKKTILDKDKLTKKDEKELESISKKLEEIPLNDQQANDAIEALKKATAILKA